MLSNNIPIFNLIMKILTNLICNICERERYMQYRKSYLLYYRMEDTIIKKY